jgi:hypothetical protein
VILFYLCYKIEEHLKYLKYQNYFKTILKNLKNRRKYFGLDGGSFILKEYDFDLKSLELIRSMASQKEIERIEIYLIDRQICISWK